MARFPLAKNTPFLSFSLKTNVRLSPTGRSDRALSHRAIHPLDALIFDEGVPQKFKLLLPPSSKITASKRNIEWSFWTLSGSPCVMPDEWLRSRIVERKKDGPFPDFCVTDLLASTKIPWQEIQIFKWKRPFKQNFCRKTLTFFRFLTFVVIIFKW